MKLSDLHLFKWFRRRIIPIRRLTEHEKGWFEGYLDADGSLTIIKVRRAKIPRGYYYVPHMVLYSTNKEAMEKVRNFIQYGYVVRVEYKKRPECKPLYRYYLSGAKLKKLLEQMTLIIKEKQRLLLIEAIDLLAKKGADEELAYKRLDEICAEIRRLNKRGR